MAKITVKPEYAHCVFGFNNSGKPLGERDDLHLLIEDARAHNLTHILNMFEELPDEEQLLSIKAEKFIERHNRKKKRKQQ